MEKFYITTALAYVNAVPHIGHAYECIMADVLARYHRIKGDRVFFLTGTDEHGEKIQSVAEKKGIQPQEFADEIVPYFKDMWRDLSISYDDFIRTTEDRHVRVVKKIFETLVASGDVYLGKYSGWYCVPCGDFWTQTQLTGENCPECGRKVEHLEEDAYFFRMSKYANAILRHYEENPDFIRPSSKRKEIINFVKEGLKDLCITRSALSWGIPVPGREDYTIYVWFDALLSYISAAGYEDAEGNFSSLWPADMHIVGKDILKFHVVIWPSILLAAGIPLPKSVFAHGWWMVDGRKISKSLGNTIDPRQIMEKHSPDALRYFLLREISPGLDGTFSIEAFEARFNADLANDFGNLLNRSLSMIDKYFGGRIPPCGPSEDMDRELTEKADTVIKDVPGYIETLNLNFALERIWQFINSANKYIEDSTPWTLKKNGSPRLGTVMYNLAESLRVIAILVYPFMPVKAADMWVQIGMEGSIEDIRLDAMAWGKTVSETMTRKGSPLFPRIEKKQ